MTESRDILDAAQALRPHLHLILDDDKANSIGAEVDNLLQRAEGGEHVDDLLLNHLTKEDALLEWLQAALEDGTSKGVIEASRGVTLPGDVGPVSSERYRCSKSDCDFTWHLRRIGQPVPPCPVHKSELVQETQEG